MSLETGAYQCDKALVTSYKGPSKPMTMPPNPPLPLPSINKHHHTSMIITSNTCTT